MFYKGYMLNAKTISTLSECKKLKVGAYIVSLTDKIVGIGYNRLVKGLEGQKSEYYGENNELITRPEVIHAEADAILNASYTKNCVMYITHAPCFECAKLIVHSGIKEVYYNKIYREDKESFELLRTVGVKIKQIDV